MTVRQQQVAFLRNTCCCRRTPPVTAEKDVPFEDGWAGFPRCADRCPGAGEYSIMVRVTDRSQARAVGAGLLGVLFVMTAVLASVTPGRSPETPKTADHSTGRNELSEGDVPVTVPTTAVSSTTTTAVVVPATISAPARRCAAGDLRLAFGSEATAVMRQSAAYFGLENTTRRPCRLQGYPAVEFFDPAGRRINTQIWKGGGYIIQDPGPAVVELGPKATGWFGMNWVVENVRAGNLTGCVEPGSLGVTPPGSTRQLRLAVRLQTPPCLVSGFGVTALAAGDRFAGAFTAPTPGN